jgi:ribosomal-protein-alanine N-acetyltransferase
VSVALERPAARHRVAFVAAARRSRRLHAGLVSPPRDAEAYRAYLRDCRRANRERYLIVEDGELVGAASLNEIVRGAFQSAYLGYYAFVPQAGRGLMRQGLALVLDRAFGEHRLHRVEANIQPGNQASLALARRLGFETEGYSPGYLKVSGRWRDHERLALRAPEWRKHKRSRGRLA